MSDPAPTLAAAHARIAAVDPTAYARSRNALDGAVTGLSPYINHGLVSLPEVLAGVLARGPLELQHSVVRELGWRAYFQHVWQHRGEGILQSLHAGPLPDEAYAQAMPEDVREARSGVPVIDQAVRQLYATGLLHNHARLWLASYLVHVRKVHWRCGADWMLGHLLDGDLASNHLSWQWVAGTGSHKPYLFNADNVARYAPAAWHSPGSVIDVPYEVLERLARTAGRGGRQTPGPRGRGLGAAPAGNPPAAERSMAEQPTTELPTAEPPRLGVPPPALGAVSPDANAVRGRDVWLVHPWSLGALPADLAPDTLVIGLLLADIHRTWPWTERRWAFVGKRLGEIADCCWHGEAAAVALALAGAGRVRCVDEPHLAPWLGDWVEARAPAALFLPVAEPCASFSRWWSRATRGLREASDLLHPRTPSA